MYLPVVQRLDGIREVLSRSPKAVQAGSGSDEMVSHSRRSPPELDHLACLPKENLQSAFDIYVTFFG